MIYSNCCGFGDERNKDKKQVGKTFLNAAFNLRFCKQKKLMDISHFLWFILKIYAQKVLFTQTQLKKIGLRKKSMDSVLWAQNRHFYLRLRRQNIYLPKTKRAAPKGHPLLPLMFLENKRCIHSKVGTCMATLPFLQLVHSNQDGEFRLRDRAHVV